MEDTAAFSVIIRNFHNSFAEGEVFRGNGNTFSFYSFHIYYVSSSDSILSFLATFLNAFRQRVNFKRVLFVLMNPDVIFQAEKTQAPNDTAENNTTHTLNQRLMILSQQCGFSKKDIGGITTECKCEGAKMMENFLYLCRISYPTNKMVETRFL